MALVGEREREGIIYMSTTSPFLYIASRATIKGNDVNLTLGTTWKIVKCTRCAQLVLALQLLEEGLPHGLLLQSLFMFGCSLTCRNSGNGDAERAA